MDLSTWAKLAVTWIILECYFVVDLISDSVRIFQTLGLELLFFTLHFFEFFSKRMNNTNKYNNIIGCISSFQNGKNVFFFYFWAFFFSKRKFLRQWHFCFLVAIQSIQFLWQYVFVRFEKSFFLLTTGMPMTT